MADATIVIKPRLSMVEAVAIKNLLGNRTQTYGLRTTNGTPDWLEKHFKKPTEAIDELVSRFSDAISAGDAAVSAMAFNETEGSLIQAAMDHELYGWKNNATFIERFGIDIRRAQHLQVALRYERTIAEALQDTPAGPERSRAEQLRDEAQTMRGSRHARFNGVETIDLNPELNLLHDARQLLLGSTTLSPVQADVIRAWRSYGRDVEAARERRTMSSRAPEHRDTPER
jgi:hypothetical protein